MRKKIEFYERDASGNLVNAADTPEGIRKKADKIVFNIIPKILKCTSLSSLFYTYLIEFKKIIEENTGDVEIVPEMENYILLFDDEITDIKREKIKGEIARDNRLKEPNIIRIEDFDDLKKRSEKDGFFGSITDKNKLGFRLFTKFATTGCSEHVKSAIIYILDVIENKIEHLLELNEAGEIIGSVKLQIFDLLRIIEFSPDSTTEEIKSFISEILYSIEHSDTIAKKGTPELYYTNNGIKNNHSLYLDLQELLDNKSLFHIGKIKIGNGKLEDIVGDEKKEQIVSNISNLLKIFIKQNEELKNCTPYVTNGGNFVIINNKDVSGFSGKINVFYELIAKYLKEKYKEYDIKTSKKELKSTSRGTYSNIVNILKTLNKQ